MVESECCKQLIFSSLTGPVKMVLPLEYQAVVLFFHKNLPSVVVVFIFQNIFVRMEGRAAPEPILLEKESPRYRYPVLTRISLFCEDTGTYILFS